MIVTDNGNNSYTLDELTLTKNTYNVSTKIKVNDIEVATSLPYTFTYPVGVHSIVITMNSTSAEFVDKYCLLVDPNLYCDIVTRLGKMDEQDRVASELPYMYFLLTKGVESNTCNCQCDNIKLFYKELKNNLTDCGC